MVPFHLSCKDNKVIIKKGCFLEKNRGGGAGGGKEGGFFYQIKSNVLNVIVYVIYLY